MPTITGKVLSKQDSQSEPLPGVLVGILSATAEHPDLASRTDADGSYSLEGLAPGTYLISAAGTSVKTTISAKDDIVACDILAGAPLEGDTGLQEPVRDPAGKHPAGDGSEEADDLIGEPESFSDDPTARDTPDDGGLEAAEISLIDRGLVYAILSLRIGAGLRDRDALTDAAYQALHPDEQLPFSTDDPDLEQKSREWLELRDLVDPLLGDAPPPAPRVTTTEGFGLPAQRLPDGRGYRVRRNGINWLDPRVIDAIQAIGKAWDRRNPGTELWMLDGSKREGGPVGNHKSHRIYRDIDMQLRIDGQKLCMTKARYAEWRVLWQDLADLVHANGVLPVKVIGFSDKLVSGVSNWAGHYCHFHVRFCAPPDQIAAVEAAVAELYSDKPRRKRPNYRCRSGAFEAGQLPAPDTPRFELHPVDYLDAESQAEAAAQGITLVQRGFAYAAIGLAYARGVRGKDRLTDEGWQAVYPDAPFPLRSWHDAFGEKRRAWLDIRSMVEGFLDGIGTGARPPPKAPATCVNAGRAELRRLASAAEAAGAPTGFAIFAEAAAWTESRWNNCAVNDSPSEAAAALRLFEGAKGRGWFPDNPYGAEEFGIGSMGWFGGMGATMLIAGGNRGPFINAHPQLVKDPVASIVMIADFAVRVTRKYKVRHMLDIRRGMAGLRLIGAAADNRERAQLTRARFDEGLRRAGVDDPEAFMLRKPDISRYPGAWELWLQLDAQR
ncbi:Penicillin-insensitive murein endopeptidase [Cribrihabitans marinus]|uniref:Penicillin-insensitive murein endopeptidase n=1 Tax=Cribrihabitans marinus TaxID=1227549 RepID=A0A1H7DA42_9RHOB|nr:carboxypeptidase-like regulatory domain-containing protein [Cribrihabitans marinus]GGH37983.1 hypothetical protein GCM10010973_32890 [Cribrihabitans marinus]SEJ97737.1 Penicillin-insensitive murein endopeptidase [Cribrihabitans marinus]